MPEGSSAVRPTNGLYLYLMIHEILSISFQMLNAMPTEIKFQYHQDVQELVHQAVQFDITNCKETCILKNKHYFLRSDLRFSQQC